MSPFKYLKPEFSPDAFAETSIGKVFKKKLKRNVRKAVIENIKK